MNRNSLFCCMASIGFLGITGCVDERSVGTSRVFTYELWVPLSVLVGGIVAGPAGWFLRSASSRFGWGLLVIGPVAALFFAPSLFRDRAIVDDGKFFHRSGIWGLTAVHEVDLENLRQVRITSEEVRGRRGAKRLKYYMLCEKNNGESVKVPINNNVAEAAAPHFLQKVSDRGIPVINET